MDEKILRILRTHRQGFISGDELSRKSGLDMATVNRYIHQLCATGYDIQAQPHGGYKLISVPDKLLAQELAWRLKTKIIGKKILSFNSVDSTNTVAFSLAKQGAGEGTAVFAEGQKKGRGRLGRSWLSPQSKGIYLSLILRPQIPAQKPALITLLAAVACAEAIRKVCGLTAQIRWPNDILVNSKKVCGILTEMQAQNNLIKFLILGIGINVNIPEAKLPPEASSLQKESSRRSEFSRLELARALLYQLEQEYLHFKRKGSARLVVRWKNLSCLSGKRVKVFFAHKTIEGLAQDIDGDGALIVRLDNGFKQHVLAGDVVKVR